MVCHMHLLLHYAVDGAGGPSVGQFHKAGDHFTAVGEAVVVCPKHQSTRHLQKASKDLSRKAFNLVTDSFMPSSLKSL